MFVPWQYGDLDLYCLPCVSLEYEGGIFFQQVFTQYMAPIIIMYLIQWSNTTLHFLAAHAVLHEKYSGMASNRSFIVYKDVTIILDARVGIIPKQTGGQRTQTVNSRINICVALMWYWEAHENVLQWMPHFTIELDPLTISGHCSHIKYNSC